MKRQPPSFAILMVLVGGAAIWQHQADSACTIGPYVPPRLPGNN